MLELCDKNFFFFPILKVYDEFATNNTAPASSTVENLTFSNKAFLKNYTRIEVNNVLKSYIQVTHRIIHIQKYNRCWYLTNN